MPLPKTEEEIAAETKAAEEAAQATKLAADAAAAKAAGEPDPTKQTGPAPNFDPTVISEAVQKGLQAFVKDNPEQPGEKPRPVAVETNPLAEAINPLIQPGLDRANLGSENAMDLSRFYIKHPEAKDHMDEVEAAFQDSVKQGTPTSREYLWDAFRGRNMEKFMKIRDEENAAKLKLAKDNQDLGGGGGGSPPGGKVDVDYKTPEADVTKALDGREF